MANDVREVVLLHSAARRYCIEEYAKWTNRYSDLTQKGLARAGREYTQAAYDTFPRYNILRAILIDIERLDPSDISDCDEVRDLILLAGATAEDMFTKKPACRTEAAAIEDERRKFDKHISSLSLQALADTPLLPYRRVLAREESRSVWSRVAARWDIALGEYWYPLTGTKPSHVDAFDSGTFHQNVLPSFLQDALRAAGINRVWDLSEFATEPEYESAVALLEVVYGIRGEQYLVSSSMDWIIYASHESSVTVGGWMLDEVKRHWSNWEQHRWKPWDLP